MRATIVAILAMIVLSGCDAITPLPASPTPTAAVIRVVTPTALATIVPSPTPLPATSTATLVPPTPTSLPAALVVSAGGDGVFIRIVPEKPDRYKAWADGTAMVVVGPDRTVSGQVWKNVRDPDGNVGWIPAQYLASAPTATPTAAA